MSLFDIGLSAIWLAAGIRVGWLLCDYRRFAQRIERERQR